MITIYLHGCSTCGVNSVFVRKIKAYGQSTDIPVEVMNSRYNVEALASHTMYLLLVGLSVGEYTPIVVQDGQVTKLREWNK